MFKLNLIKSKHFLTKLIVGIFIFILFFSINSEQIILADTKVQELTKQIQDRKTAIAELEAQIIKTEKKINISRNTQRTLKGAIAVLDAERKKFLTEINLTQKKISTTNLEIKSLSLNIVDKNQSIVKSNTGLGQIIRMMNKIESKPMVVSLLGQNNLSEFWQIVEENQALNKALLAHLDDLRNIKYSLEVNKKEALSKQAELNNLKKELSARKKIVDNNKYNKKKLLSSTKNQESAYQKILKSQSEKRKAFERELLEFESALSFEIDKSKLPNARHGILNWPLAKIRITQYFGNTSFAKQNSNVYNGQGHNGVDFGSPIGTSVISALAGKVIGYGNTDKTCPRASYGKWILIEHYNGLSTLYAHLSVIGVNVGQTIKTGERIAYSGNTGYTTGPHLHFTVYATQGVKIMDRQSRACGGIYTMPIADLRAYLNPLLYLPK